MFFICLCNLLADGCLENKDLMGLSELGKPDDIDVCIELKDWLFALEGSQDIGEDQLYYNVNGTRREERFWQTTFKVLQVKFKSNPEKSDRSGKRGIHNYPMESIKVKHFTYIYYMHYYIM